MARSRTSIAQLQQHEATLKASLAKKRQSLAVQHAQIRARELKALNHRRFVVGKLVLDLPALACLPLEQLQEALRWLAWGVEDEGRFQTWLRESRETAAPVSPQRYEDLNIAPTPANGTRR
jgi:hypothetical protein